MEIIFVHLGSASARHLWLNIQRLKRIHPDLEITVIISDLRHLEKLKSLKVEPFVYKQTTDTHKILMNLEHNSNFRQGFWIYSLERFYALHQWHKNYKEKSYLHVESDILVMGNFPFLKFTQIKDLAWCRFNETHDVASLVYSPDFLHTHWLIQRLNEQIESNPKLTDMTALSAISHENRILILLL